MNADSAALIDFCSSHGLDLAARLQAAWYNGRVPAAHRIEDFGRADAETIVIGNTRALWKPFMAALSSNQYLAQSANPIDDYIEQVVNAGLTGVAAPFHLRWAHRAAPAHLSFQTLAEVAGLAWRSPASLSVHRVHGPWIALRAAIVFDRSVALPQPPAFRTCTHCAAGCEPALRRVLSMSCPDWQDWLAVRDACPTGKASRYSDLQIHYHYTKRRELLGTAG